MKKLLSLALSSALLFSAPAQAADRYEYDPLHTQVFFSVNHFGYTDSFGRFNKFTGGFTLDEQHPEKSEADIAIDVNSLDMADATWNEHVQAKFLNGDKFPAITFKSTAVKQTGEKTAELTGALTPQGVTNPVTLQVRLNKVGPHPMMATQADAGFTLTGTLKRSDFGIDTFIPAISDEVTLRIEVDGKRTIEAPAEAK